MGSRLLDAMMHRVILLMTLVPLLAIGCTASAPTGPSSADPAATDGLPERASADGSSTADAVSGTELPSGEAVTEWGLAAPDELIVWYSGCESSPPVTIEETDERVLVLVSGPNGLCEPLFAQEIELELPLGDRVVVDRSTGAVVQRGVFGPPSRDALTRAEERWAAAGISDYRLHIVVTLSQVGFAEADGGP